MKTRQTAKHGALLALAALAFLAAPSPVSAGNWVVNGVPDLIAAINAANQVGGANTIILAGGRTYTLTAVDNTSNGANGLPVIAVNNSLTIRGNGATLARSTAAGTPAFRFLDVAPGATLTLENLTIANGLVGAAPGMGAFGGAVFNEAGATLNVTRTTFVANQVVGGDGGQKAGGLGLGGAIENEGSAGFDHVTFSGNQAFGGATMHGHGSGGSAAGGAIDNGGSLAVRDCSFTGNRTVGGLRRSPSADYDGLSGGGAINNGKSALVTDSTFNDNQGVGGTGDPGVDGGFGLAGAISSGGSAASPAVISVLRCTFTHNQAIGGDADPDSAGGTACDGAIGQIASALTIADCVFTDNQALGARGGIGGWAQGGAVGSESPETDIGICSTLTISNCTFADNKALGSGAGGVGLAGAVWNADWLKDDGSGARMVISDCTFTGNEARGAAGGDGGETTAPAFGQSGAVDTSGNTTILRCIFRDNRAIGGTLLPGVTPSFDTVSAGGGIGSWAGNLEVRDSSFVGNQVIGTAGSTGSGKIPSSGGSIAMGGGITIDSGLTATIVNCWFSDNGVTGGAGGGAAPGGAGVGGGLSVGFYPYPGFYAIGKSSTVTISGTTITRNQAIGGAEGGEGLGGGYAVGTGVLFRIRDTSSVTLNGGSVVTNNLPDDIFQF